MPDGPVLITNESTLIIVPDSKMEMKTISSKKISFPRFWSVTFHTLEIYVGRLTENTHDSNFEKNNFFWKQGTTSATYPHDLDSLIWYYCNSLQISKQFELVCAIFHRQNDQA